MNFQKPTYTYRVKEVTKYVDGDTIDVLLDVGFKIHVHKRLRFLDFDASEVRGKSDLVEAHGRAATRRLEELLSSADAVYVQTVMDAEGKYGRVLAHVLIENGGELESVNQRLVAEGFSSDADQATMTHLVERYGTMHK